MDRAKIRAAAEKVLSAGKMNVMLLPCEDIIALLTAPDEAEKLWDIKEWPCQTHLRAKTMEKHLEQIQTMFGDKLDSPLQQQNRELILENSRVRDALELYGDHDHNCELMVNEFSKKECDCGFSKVLAQALTPASSQVILDN